MYIKLLIAIFVLTMAMTSDPNTLRIACWNLRGFNSAVPYVRRLLEDNDILLLSEHWLHANRLSRLNEIAGDINFCARASNF